MNSKNRIETALKHKNTDIVPYSISFTIPAESKLAKHYYDKNIVQKIGNHLASVHFQTSWEEIKQSFWKDEFGVIWNRTVDKDIGVIENNVLEKSSLEGFKLPDPYDKNRFAHFKSYINRYKELFILSDIGFSLFERAWTLRGMENLLCDMVSNPEFVEELLDIILEFNMGIIEQSIKYEIDGMLFGDDWGQQNGLIMGPKLWRKFIKPRIARMYAKVKEAKIMVFIHSCGDVEEIFPDLIEVGVDVFNPFQPEVYDIYKIKRLYGNQLSFFGGMSTQRVLPFGTVDQVKNETKKLLKEIGEDGGYIFSPAHSVPADVPVENIIAMLDVLQNQVYG